MIYLDPAEPQDEPLPVHEHVVELDDATITYRLRWLARQASWYLDLYDSTGALLVSGLRCAPGWPVTARHPLAGLPPGRLYFLDPSETFTAPTMEGLGLTHFLVYLDAAEVADLPEPETSFPPWSVVPEE